MAALNRSPLGSVPSVSTVNEIADGRAGPRGRARDADRFGARRHRDGRDHVRARGGQRFDLRPMHALRIGVRHRRSGDIAVAARAHAAADDDRARNARDVLRLEVLHQCDRVAVDSAHRRSVEPELRAPVGAGAPGWTLENEAGLGCRGGELEIAAEVAPQASAALRDSSSTKAANSGSAMPSWKINTVSMPASVKNQPPSCCGRRNCASLMFVLRLRVQTMGGTIGNGRGRAE